MIADSTITYITLGAILGLSAGLSPGPLLTLVISETLQHNKSEGIKIAFAPIITDLPVILLSYFVFSRFVHYQVVLGFISVVGGIYVLRLGYLTLKTKPISIDEPRLKPQSFKKGVLTNFLNPNPYFFWFTVGIPMAYKAYEISLVACSLFFISFYTLIIGSVIVIALVVERTKIFLNSGAYIWVMRLLGIALLVFAVFLFYDAWKIFYPLK